MKHFILLFSLLLALKANAQNVQVVTPRLNIDSMYKAKEMEAIGKPFAEFSANYNGQIFTNKNLKGKIVFINFWFAACPPCRAELSELNTLYDSIKETKDFEFISFTFENEKVINEFARKYKIKYKVLSVSSKQCLQLNRDASFPTSIIIDRVGTIKYLKMGGSLDPTEIYETIFNEYYPVMLKQL